MGTSEVLFSENHIILVQKACITLEAKNVSKVVISIPHDGLLYADLSGLFNERKIGYKVRDKYVWPIAKDISLKYPISAIRGLMPRALIDYNRSWPKGINYYPKTQKEVHTALDDVRLVELYQHYHSEIDRLVSAAIKKYGVKNCLLIDLHGFGKQPPYAPEGGFDLIFGTGNRKTILYGDIDQRLCEFLLFCGYKVFLPKELSLGEEEDYYSADFTTRSHSKRNKINAIQIEIASKFRNKESVELGKKLSSDLAEFFKKDSSFV